MTFEERLDRAVARKSDASRLFQEKRMRLAAKHYEAWAIEGRRTGGIQNQKLASGYMSFPARCFGPKAQEASPTRLGALPGNGLLLCET